MESFKIGPHDVDFSKAIPLTLGDAKKLKAIGLDLLKMQELDADQLVAFVTYIAQKAEPKVTENDVLEVPLSIVAVIAQMVAAEPDADFLSSSTSSDENMDGRKPTLKH